MGPLQNAAAAAALTRPPCL